MEVTINPYIYYISYVCEGLKILVIGCSGILFFTALFAIMSKNDINKIMEYNMVFKREDLRIADLKKENDIKSKKAKKWVICGIILVLISLFIPTVETAYYMLINL